MTKVIIYRDADGVKQRREFNVKGSRNSTGLRIDKDSEAESIRFARDVDFLISFYVK